MNGHQVRNKKLFCAMSEVIATTYGWVPPAIIEDIAAETILAIALYQAHNEAWVREQATKAGYTPADAADMVSELHAPMGGAAA